MYTIIGDLHVTHKSLDIIDKLFSKIESMNNSTIIMGDVFDTKEILRGKCLNLVYRRLKDSKLEYYIIVGNHDLFNLTSKEHTLEVLKELPNVTIIDKLTELESNVFAIPYIHDVEELKATIKNIPKNAALFAHLELKGFDFGNGFICDKGMTGKSFTKFKRVISGHFHKYQEKNNLTYIGASYSMSFGEANQVKYIGVYDTGTDELELIRTEFPQHITVDYNVDVLAPERKLDWDSKHHYRVILTGLQENISKVDKSVFPKGTKIIERPNDDMVNGLIIEETLDNKVKFNKWANDIKGLDSETIQLGLDIMEAVK